MKDKMTKTDGWHLNIWNLWISEIYNYNYLTFLSLAKLLKQTPLVSKKYLSVFNKQKMCQWGKKNVITKGFSH